MGLVDHEGKFEVSYTKEDVLSALEGCINKIDGFCIDKVDEKTGSINLKAGMSLFSWGENITITVSETQNGKTSISIMSTPKTGILFGGANDMGKNRKNINKIMEYLSDELNNYKAIEPKSNIDDKENVYNQIRQLAQLKDDRILTEDEFNNKKKELLKSI